MGDSSAAQALSLPQGGGAIKGIGETFQPNLFTGTGHFSVPIATSPGRAGFEPKLSLDYSTGNGNGPFGLGWQLSIPRITRKTEKGLPKYTDDDVFVMSGAEDLVPTGEIVSIPPDADSPTYTVKRYRPRTEGLFARIERWEKHGGNEDDDVHWRATTKDNVTSIYGRTTSARICCVAENARITDPDSRIHVFEWLLEETYDAKGNHILYEYVREAEHPEIDAIYEQNRTYESQIYIRRIYYGNTPEFDGDPAEDYRVGPKRTGVDHESRRSTRKRHYVFEVLFDYGDLAPEPRDAYRPPGDQSRQESTAGWPATTTRQDPFSSFRAGFEVRTLRRCQRVLIVHHFQELDVNGGTVVRSTDFDYADDPQTLLSLLKSVQMCGYRKEERDPPAEPKWWTGKMPPVEFKYSEFRPHEQRYQSLDARGNDLPPRSLRDPNFALFDACPDGLPDILHTSNTGFRYWRNLGNGTLDMPRTQQSIPAGITLADAGVAVGDMGGDGLPDLIVQQPGIAGFYEAKPEGGWQRFKAFRRDACPSFSLADPNVRLVDLTGDGLSDALMTSDRCLYWFECLGEEGYARAKSVLREHNLDKFPDVYFNDPSARVRLADMTGDGLNDIVLLHSGRIDYWPNLGYGQFGKRITMEDAPHLEYGYDPERLFLADLDGSGCVDLVYVGFDRVHFWFNQSGNGWSEEQVIHGTPIVSDQTGIQFADVFGTGTATLLWSYDYNFQPGGNYKALDFCGGIKPYVLTEMDNNMGATTRVQYAPSTKFHTEDRKNGLEWATTLPFPVHVVEKVEVIDHIGKTKLVTTYKYHHGYYDGREREFRGFGRVDQFDTETFDDFIQPGLHDDAELFENDSKAFHAPPVETRSWFHTGIYYDPDRATDHRELTRKYRDEFYDRDPDAFTLDDHIVAHSGTPHEAYRTLRGSLLRTEVYAHDGTDKEQHPYVVTENRYEIKELQARNGNAHGVYHCFRKEGLSYHYERNPSDPRISHALTLEVDDYGNVLKSAEVGYGRRHPDTALQPEDREKQTQSLLTYTEARVTNVIDTPSDYRTPLPCETRTYELTGYAPGSGEHFRASDFLELDPSGTARPAHIYDTEIAYEAKPASGRQRRLIEHARVLYRPDDFGDSQGDPFALLPLGEVEPLAIPGDSYKLAFTPGLLTQVYQRTRDDVQPVDAPPYEELISDANDVLPTDTTQGEAADRGGYVSSQALRGCGCFPTDNTDPNWALSDADGHWWIPSGRIYYSADSDDTPATELDEAKAHFFLPRRYCDPFYIKNAWETENLVHYDRYDLLMKEACDALGNVTASLNDYRVLQPKEVIDPNENRLEVAFDALGLVVGTAVKGQVTAAAESESGDTLEDFAPDLEPSKIEEFFSDPKGKAADVLKGATTRVIYDLDRYRTSGKPVFAATIAREAHVETPPSDGVWECQISFGYSDGFGREIQKKIQAEPETPDGPLHWVGSGWTIFNNKGKPVRQYEPFFSDLPPNDRHCFEFGKKAGVSPILFHDPLDRAVTTLHPNRTYEKVVFGPWQQTTYDVNDTVAPRNDQTGDPRTDPDIRGYVAEHFTALQADPADSWKTWYEERSAGDLGQHEKDAADKAAAHADTPTTAHLDTLGRPFLTLTLNRVTCDNHPLDGKPDEDFRTRVELDIEGNQRAVCDERRLPVDHLPMGELEQRVVMRYDYSMAGPDDENAANRIHQASMEAGERWTLNDISGKPIRAWDSRCHNYNTKYDELRRPVERRVRGTHADQSDENTLDADVLFEKISYGEGQPNDIALNLRTRVFELRDSAGVVTNKGLNPDTGRDEAYDFKGNLLCTQRQLAESVGPENAETPAYKTTVDWSDRVELCDEKYISRTCYDALNRPVTQTTPHTSAMSASTIHLAYNEANLLDHVDANLNGAKDTDGDPVWTPFVSNIDYNAKGQRKRIDYKNGPSTHYRYDDDTFRLTRLWTVRGKRDGAHCAPAFDPRTCEDPPTTCGRLATSVCVVQDLNYTYDPAGNITHIEDNAQQPIYFKNQCVEPDNDYTYDALYRLIEATGREHVGQAGGTPISHSYHDIQRVNRHHPSDEDAMGRYIERYVYDAVGNFGEMRHHSNDPTTADWTRTYTYNEESLLEPDKQSNRLSSTQVGNAVAARQSHTYDAHGDMTNMSHLPVMRWEHRDQLQSTAQQVVNHGGTPETTYYVYDASGQRVRKVTLLANGNLKDERIYLGGFEIYREYEAPSAGSEQAVELERETLHIIDDQQRVALVETKTLDHGARIPHPVPLSRYQFGNHLGSATLELDTNSKIISYEEYSAYGSTTYQAIDKNLKAAAKRYRYSGKERDGESGLDYYGARYYAAWIGRWSSCDPATLKSGPNLYVFNLGSPSCLRDPDGRKSVRDTEQHAREFAREVLEIHQESTARAHKELAPRKTKLGSRYMTEVGKKAHTYTQADLRGMEGVEGVDVEAKYRYVDPDGRPYAVGTDLDVRCKDFKLIVELKNSLNTSCPERAVSRDIQFQKQLEVAANEGYHHAIVEGRQGGGVTFHSNKEIREMVPATAIRLKEGAPAKQTVDSKHPSSKKTPPRSPGGPLGLKVPKANIAVNVGIAGLVFIGTLFRSGDVYAAAEAGHQALNPLAHTTEAAWTGGDIHEALLADAIDAVSTPGVAELEEEARQRCGDLCVDMNPAFTPALSKY